MSAWGDFFRERRQALIGYVRRRLDEAAGQDAEDLVQDVFLGLLDRADPTGPIRDLAAFVYRSLSNAVTDRFRRRRDTLPLPEDLPGAEADPAREFERREVMDAVFAAIDALSPEEKAVVLATELEGRSFRELAEEWRVPIGTLLARKSRALEKVRARLSGREE